jgi:hypothetical protein
MDASRISVKEDASRNIASNPDDVIDQSLVNLLNN